MGEEVECAPLSADALEVLEWLAEVMGVTLQEAAEMAAREGLKQRREAMWQKGEVIPFRRPGKA